MIRRQELTRKYMIHREQIERRRMYLNNAPERMYMQPRITTERRRYRWNTYIHDVMTMTETKEVKYK